LAPHKRGLDRRLVRGVARLPLGEALLRCIDEELAEHRILGGELLVHAGEQVGDEWYCLGR